MLGWFADIFLGYVIRTVIHLFKSRGSRQWPKENGTVLVSSTTSGYGGPVADIIYSYTHKGRYCSGRHQKPFLSSGSAKRYVAGLPKETPIVVRVKPGDATTSIVRDDDQDQVALRLSARFD
jgi:hypothetical protein